MIKVYGASDDLIEIDSDDPNFKSEEFNVSDPDDGYVLAFSDATVLAINWDRFGIWRIVPLFQGINFRKIEFQSDDGGSDVAFMDSDNLKWVVLGVDMVLRAGR